MKRATNLLENGYGITRHGDRVQRFVLENSIEDFVLVIATEWRLPEQHLIHEHTERPPVDSATVALLQEDLSDNVSHRCDQNRK
jgi:hypothetical protein